MRISSWPSPTSIWCTSGCPRCFAPPTGCFLVMRHPGRHDPEEWDVYALTAGRVPQRLRARGRSVRVMVVGPIGVIVGAPRAADTPTETALREQHAIVLSLAEQIDPILPARFGSRMTADRLEAAI